MTDDFTLSLQDAAQILRRSERTIQRLLQKGRLSKKYIATERGQELRLSQSEVKQLADNPPSNGVTPHDKGDDNGVTPDGTFFGIEPKEFLRRYESVITQMGYLKGQLEAKEQEMRLLTGRTQEMVNQLRSNEQKAAQLAREKERLEQEQRQAAQARAEAERKAKELQEALESERRRLAEQVASSQTTLQYKEQQLLEEQRRARIFKIIAISGAFLLLIEILYLVIVGPRLP
jgi:hypothetical protein